MKATEIRGYGKGILRMICWGEMVLDESAF